ncbi:MAG: GIY-YIG nuclease family protein [Oscillospiraceae bacterium]
MGIYKITNTMNNKVYIGETLNIDRRWNEHRLSLSDNTHFIQSLQDDYNQYGESVFNYSIEELFPITESNFKYTSKLKLKTVLILRENAYVLKYNALFNGYNTEDTMSEIISGHRSMLPMVDIKTSVSMVYRLSRSSPFLLNCEYQLTEDDILIKKKNPKIARDYILNQEKGYRKDVRFYSLRCLQELLNYEYPKDFTTLLKVNKMLTELNIIEKPKPKSKVYKITQFAKDSKYAIINRDICITEFGLIYVENKMKEKYRINPVA